MKPIETVRDFINGYFDARTHQIQLELTAHQPFRSKYYSESCIWDSRPLAVEISKSEKIISITECDGFVVLVTHRLEHSPKLRYTVENCQGRWMIRCIQPECGICCGISGQLDCEICAGSGWLQLPEK